MTKSHQMGTCGLICVSLGILDVKIFVNYTVYVKAKLGTRVENWASNSYEPTKGLQSALGLATFY